MKHPTILLLILLMVGAPIRSRSQCLSFTGHPFGTCTLGDIALSSCPPGLDSVVWSNGYVGMWAQGLPLGAHSYMAYDDGVVVAADTLQVQQLAWSITGVGMEPMGFGYAISGWVEVPWCSTSASNTPCCIPDPANTYLRLVQDGTTEITTSPCVNCDMVYCSGTTFMFQNVPPGHTYQVRLYDLTCGLVITDTTTMYVPLETAIGMDGATAAADGALILNGSTVTVRSSASAFTEVLFFDRLGRHVELPEQAPGTYDMAQLAPGIYLAHVRLNEARRTYRFIRH